MARASLGGGIKGLLRTLFEAGHDADDDIQTQQEQEEAMDEPSYHPNRFDGEYTAWFEAKPLGIGLVPSTQLYGAWEVSSVPGNQTRRTYDVDVPHVEITTGDVVIALNFRCKKAQLSRAAFAAYISKCACPIAVTLRKPDVYGAFDSRSMATAMYPTSMDYQGRHLPEKKAIARASSQQWTRTLQHDLSVRGSRTGRNESASPVSSMDEDSSVAYRLKPPAVHPREMAASDMSPQGEFTHVIPKKPIHLVLAPSTRLYGSVEIYDPRVHAPTVQIGDVIMAVNGDTSVARWATDDLIDHIQGLQPPITLRLRRPLVYRKYLQQYFRGKKSLASESTAHAMFPDSAEYKNSPPLAGGSRKQAPGKQLPVSTPGLKHRQSTTAVVSPPPKTDRIPREERRASTEDALRDLRAFASRLNASDQFSFIPTSVDPSSSSSQSSTMGDHSSLLTKKHVQFLWKYLPTYLSCNDLELVYTSRRHGWNSMSFYSMLEDKGPTILVLQDQRDNLFGAFCSASWRKTGDIYGNGRSFVFTLRPQMKAFPWSGLENSFMYSRRDAVFIGGGKKGIALCLQLDERRGFTQPCDTFDSPALATRGEFECEVCEVWCFSGLKI